MTSQMTDEVMSDPVCRKEVQDWEMLGRPVVVRQAEDSDQLLEIRDRSFLENDTVEHAAKWGEKEEEGMLGLALWGDRATLGELVQDTEHLDAVIYLDVVCPPHKYNY